MGAFCMHVEKEDIANCLPHQSVLELCKVIVNSTLNWDIFPLLKTA